MLYAVASEQLLQSPYTYLDYKTSIKPSEKLGFMASVKII